MQYALYALRQRQLAGNPIRGTKTLKRNARRRQANKASRGVCGGDLQGGDDDGGDSDGTLASVRGASSTRRSGGGGGGGGKTDKTKARARALSNAVATVLDEADKYRSRRSSDFSVAAPSSSSSSAGGGEATMSSLMPSPPWRGGKPEASES